MKKLQLTKQADQDLNKINAIGEFLDNPDYIKDNAPEIDPYYDMSSYDILVMDMGMFCDGAYGENKFESIEQFAREMVYNGGAFETPSEELVTKVISEINKAIKFEIVEVIEC